MIFHKMGYFVELFTLRSFDRIFHNKLELVLQKMIRHTLKYYFMIGFFCLPLLANEKIDQYLTTNNSIIMPLNLFGNHSAFYASLFNPL